MNFVAIDFETACYKQESACSVGLVKFQNKTETGFFYSLIRPPRLYIRPDFTRIHGLTVKDVKDAPSFAEIWDSIKAFIGDLPLAAHNALFDMAVLRAALNYYALPVPPIRYFCTLALSRRVWPELGSHALTALAKNFRITYKAHDALDDARTCGKLIHLAAEQSGSGSLEKLPGVNMNSLSALK